LNFTELKFVTKLYRYTSLLGILILYKSFLNNFNYRLNLEEIMEVIAINATVGNPNNIRSIGQLYIFIGILILIMMLNRLQRKRK